MQIILFGNQGQVGREIEELAGQKNIQVCGFDVNNCDITDYAQVYQAIKNNAAAQVVINAAAYTAVDKAEDEVALAYAINRDGVANLAKACKEFNLPLLHISTDYVFSGDKSGAYSEEDAVAPVGVYGKSKLAGDMVLQQSWEKHVILRVSWVFGKHGNNFVKTILRLARERETLNIVGDQFGCPTAAADIARVLLTIAEKITQQPAVWGVYNYAGAATTTWYDFASAIVTLGKNKFPLQVKQINKITTDQFPTKAKRPKNSELLVAKIIRDYGIERHKWMDYLVEVIAAL